MDLVSSCTEVNSVIYDSGSVPDKSIFSPRETLPDSQAELDISKRIWVEEAIVASKGISKLFTRRWAT